MTDKIQQDRQCTYNLTLIGFRVTTIALKKQQVLNIMSVSVSLLYLPGMQIVSFLLRILLSSVACLSLPYFSTLFPIRQDYRKKIFEHIISIFIFSTTLV